MSISPYGDSIMIINQKKIKDLGKFYICVSCLDIYNCHYNLRFDQNFIQRMPMLDISYNYFVSQDYIKINLG